MRASSIRRFVALVAAFVVVLSGSPQVADAATCSASQLVPNLSRFEVNQGLGSYERLTRGKNTLVRAYFSLPSSATCTVGSGQALNITNATLSFAAGGISAAGIAAANAAGLGTSPALSAPPALVNSAHDPLFVVAPITPAAPASFEATFTVNITYTRKLSAQNVTPGLIATFTAVKTFDQQSKAIRVLFQPLGDTSATTTQFTDADRQSVVNAVQTLLRVLPVPAGPPGSLRPTARSGGIRYEIVPSLMNVKSITNAYKLIGGTQKFCPTASVFTALAPTLGAALDAFNSVQAAEDAADFVVGVYGETISGGSADGCALGMAAASSKVSIARAVADKPKSGGTPAVVSLTGGVLAQEILHNLGAQPSPRSNGYHSSYTQADSTDPDGAYNLSAVTYIAGDKTVMNVSTGTGPWDNNVTLLEQPDYAFALCRFGGTVLTGAECTVSDPGGTLTGVAASDSSYIAAGDTTSGVSNAYFAAAAVGTAAGTEAAPKSLYRLLQLGVGGAVLSDTGIPVALGTTHGDGTVAGVFAFALPRFSAGVTETRIVKLNTLADPPLGGQIIFKALKNLAAPTVESLSASDSLVFPGATVNITKSVTPPENPDGDIVFFADTTGSMQGAIDDVRTNAASVMSQIRTEQPLSQFAVASYKDFNLPTGCTPSSTYQYRLEQAVTSNTAATQTAIDRWEASGGCDEPEAQLYALHQIATSTDPSTGFRTDPVRPRAIGWFGDAPGHDPSPDPDGITEAAAIRALQAAGIRVVAVPFTTEGNSGLDFEGQATRIATATGGAVKPAGSSDQVAAALLEGLLSATVQPQLVSCDPGLTFAVEPSQHVVRSGTESASFNETVTVATGATPGDKSCTVDFLVNGTVDPAFRQVITVGVGGTTAVAQATSYNGANAVADFFYQCPDTAKYPVAVSLKPGSISTDPSGQSSLTFAALIDASVVPGGNCTLSTRVSDLFELSSPTDPDATRAVSTVTKAPVVEIYTPVVVRDAASDDRPLFTTKAKVFATGWGRDPDGGSVTFAWTVTGPSLSLAIVASAPGHDAVFGPLAEGEYTVTLTGTDGSSTGTATRKILVVSESSPLLPQYYSFEGFFSPAKNWPDTNAVNAGQAFTAKWKIRDNNAQEVTSGGVFGAQLQRVDCVTREAIGDPLFNWEVGSTMIRYDAKGQQWVANVNIPQGVGNCYTWTLQLTDGSLHPLFLKAVK